MNAVSQRFYIRKRQKEKDRQVKTYDQQASCKINTDLLLFLSIFSSATRRLL